MTSVLQHPRLGQAVRFAIVGVSTAGIYYAALILLYRTVTDAIVIASAIAYALAIFVQYLGHALFTFGRQPKDAGQLMRFLMLNAVGLTVALTTPVLLVDHLGTSDLLAGAVVIVALPIFNFVFMARWVYAAR